MEEGEIGKELLTSGEVLRLPFAWHDQFDREVWNGKPSFHNRDHIEAVGKASEIYLKRPKKEADPLRLEESLALWNKQNPEVCISESELPEVLRWAINTHDLGNIMSEVKAVAGTLTPVFLDNYTAKNAEQRGQDIAQVLIESSDIASEKKERFVPFVRHLIGETVYKMEDPNIPFALYMRMVDQIGNDFFSVNRKRVEGLLEEVRVELPEAEIVLYDCHNFSGKRLPQLLPGENDQLVLQKIWKPLPSEKQGFSKKKVRVSTLLE